jgi:hypothetical protein
MDKPMQMLLDQSALWLPRLGGAVLVLFVFFIVSKIVRNAIIKASERLKLDSDGDKVLIPNSRLFTDPITVIKSEGCKNLASREE